MIVRAFIALLMVGALVLSGCGSGGGGSSVPTPPGSGGTDTGTGGTTPPPPTTPGDLGALDDTGDLLGSAGDNWYYTKAAAINTAGQIVGQSNNGSPVKGAFLWDPVTGAMSFLGMHVGAYDDYYGLKSTPSTKFLIYSEATAINDSGVIIGNTTTGTGWPNETEKRAFAWDSARGFMDLAPPPYFDSSGKLVSKPFSEVADINNLGNVVLTAEDATGKHAYFWDGTSFALATFEREDTSTVDVLVPVLQLMGAIVNANAEAVAINENRQAVINSGGTAVFHDLVIDVVESLNHLPGASSTVAVDINNQGAGRGHIVGNSGSHGFFWDGGSMYPIDTLGGASSEAVDLNDQDQVVGNSETAEGNTHAFLWRLGASGKGIITDLGTLGGANSFATAVNDAGQVVGYSETGETYSEGGITVNVVHAFLWANGVMYDLGTHNDFYTFPFIPPYPFSEAVAINNGGDVAGNSQTINAHYRGFYLSPTFP
jgi:probable HAF family extracellular repeat protein